MYLTSNQVPAHLRGTYPGTKFQAEPCETVTIPADAGLWDSGSRETFHAIQLSTGKQIDVGGSNRAPWDKSRQDYSIALDPDMAVVRHCMFQGKDLGLTFYVHPSAIATLLPPQADTLNEVQKTVLTATRSYKSSYMGKDRYQMAQGEYFNRDGRLFPTREQWEQAKAELIASGHLNKAGAITVKGKNATD